MKREPAFHLDPTETFPHLAHAPIVEAVIHWVARAGKPLEPHELREQLAGRLSDYPKCQPQHELQLEALFAASGSSAQRRDTWHGFRLVSSDEKHIVQFTRDGVVFSRLKPYQNWEVFSAEGVRLWKVFVELAEPTEVQRLGVRFINRIGLGDIAEVRRYLASPPKCLDPLGLPSSQFLYQSLHDVPGRPFQVNVVQTIQSPPPSQTQESGLILDIDVGTTQALPCDGSVLQQYLTQMHWLKNKAFFSLLSKKGVTLLQETNP